MQAATAVPGETGPPPLRAPRIDAVAIVQWLRLASGLTMFAYVLSHLANHALGIHSLALMEGALPYFINPWRSTVGTTLLLVAALVHLGLAFWSLYRRRRLRMPAWEAAQLGLGLMIPPLLVEHVVTTRVAEIFYGVIPDYAYVVYLFTGQPLKGWAQAALLIVAWMHACIGLHFWLRLRAWFRAALPLIFGFAILLPVLSLLGYWAAAREVMWLARDMEWVDMATGAWHMPTPAVLAELYGIRNLLWAIFAALLAGTVAGRAIRSAVERRRGLIRLTYPEGRKVAVAPGPTVLEISRSAAIRHASVCGGRGRCSTCRVRVGRGAEHLPLPSPDEAKVLRRINADPNVRLACRIRPIRDLEVAPLLPARWTGPAAARPSHGFGTGQEIEIAVLFADLRGFTSLAEHRLPYDTVFLLNRYFAEMGQAIEGAGGHLDKFIGDGIMALFGLDDGPRWGSIAALNAAKRMAERLTVLNDELRHELEQPLKLGIGIHVGPAIVGDMGYGKAIGLTAIGDVVNTASRLESMTKEYQAELVVSAEAADLAELDTRNHSRICILVRGRAQETEIVAVADSTRMVYAEDRRRQTRPRRFGIMPPTESAEASRSASDQIKPP